MTDTEIQYIEKLKEAVLNFKTFRQIKDNGIKNTCIIKAVMIETSLISLEKLIKQETINDADIEAYFNSHATEVVNNGYSTVRAMRRDDVYSFVKAALNNEIPHIK